MSGREKVPGVWDGEWEKDDMARWHCYFLQKVATTVLHGREVPVHGLVHVVRPLWEEAVF